MNPAKLPTILPIPGLLLLTLLAFPGSATSTKTLELSDRTYEDEIRTVRILPGGAIPEAQALPAVTPMGTWNLVLEFDDLRDHGDFYYLRIIRCERDWSKSSLFDLDFLHERNEFPVTEYDYSTDTQIPYIHYWVTLPPVKLPGNYVAVVYRGSDREDILLSKRFLVYDSRILFERSGTVGSGGAFAQNQQINFTINYKNLEVFNPIQDLAVTIRQNQRWDNIAEGIPPTFVREGFHELEYQYFDPVKMFRGGNEFRFFDLRSLRYPGQNVDRVNNSTEPREAYIFPDRSRSDQPYAIYKDLNGTFIVDNLDYRDLSYCDYLWVNFTLISPPVNGNVFVAGAFTQWQLNGETRMTYDKSAGAYRLRTLIKQGWYDYAYVVRSENLPANTLEGSHFQTNNMYEIFVYWRPNYQPRTDLLVGYARLYTQ